MALTHHHATIFLPPEVAAPIERVRRAWDADMAAQIAAHITLAYPQEVPDFDLLLDRLRLVSRQTRPFRLRFGELAYFGRPADGVYVAVDDVEGGFKRLHTDLVVPPMEPIPFPPHVTLIHPRTSSRGQEFWDQVERQPYATEFTVLEVTITAFDGTGWAILERCALGG